MNDEQKGFLDHLLPQQKEILAAAGQSGRQMRYIRDDLKPLVERGVSISAITRSLARLGISSREKTVRTNLRKMFPEIYQREYARKTPTPASNKAKSAPSKEKAEGSYQTSADAMLKNFEDFLNGEHLKGLKKPRARQ